MSCVFLFLSFYMRALRNSWAGYLAHWEIPCRSVGRSGKIFTGRVFGRIIKISFRSGRYIVGLSNCRNLSFGNLSSGYLHMPKPRRQIFPSQVSAGRNLQKQEYWLLQMVCCFVSAPGVEDPTSRESHSLPLTLHRWSTLPDSWIVLSSHLVVCQEAEWSHCWN